MDEITRRGVLTLIAQQAGGSSSDDLTAGAAIVAAWLVGHLGHVVGARTARNAFDRSLLRLGHEPVSLADPPWSALLARAAQGPPEVALDTAEGVIMGFLSELAVSIGPALVRRLLHTRWPAEFAAGERWGAELGFDRERCA